MRTYSCTPKGAKICPHTPINNPHDNTAVNYLYALNTSRFMKSSILLDYIREFYDVLHTTGYNYINNDIDIFLDSRGAFADGI